MPGKEIKDAALPRDWEVVFGYSGQARWLAVYWVPAGDAAMFDDGKRAARGSWYSFVTLCKRFESQILTALEKPGDPDAIDMLGSSEDEATHCLLLDLTTRKMYVCRILEGLDFVSKQWRSE